MVQMIGNLDLEAAAEALAANGYTFDDADELVAHIAAEHDLSDEDIASIDAQAVLEAHKAA